MKKVLMISYFFPPIVDVGTLRALGFSRHLPAFGWRPYVLSVKNPDTSTCRVGPEGAPDSISTFYARSLFNLNRFTWKINGALGIAFRLFGKTLHTNVVSNLLCLPDASIGWIWPSYLKGLRLIAKHQIDVIYVSCNPFSSAIAGILLKRSRRKPLVLDLRDPVSFPAFPFDPGLSARVKHRIVARIEQAVLKRADLLIVTSNEIKEQYLARYPFLTGKVRRIYNGYSLLPPSVPQQPNGTFTITYAGNFYHNLPARSPDSFFEALRIILAQRLIPRDKLRFLYLGEIRKRQNWLERARERYALQDIIDSPGWVSRDQSLQAIARSSMLLVRIVPPMISTKVFEGLAVGLPILATIEKGEVEELIRTYSTNSYIITSSDPAAIIDAITDAYTKWEQGRLEKQPSGEYLAAFNKEALTRQLAEILDGLTSVQ